ncbi:MAG TPA: hypothetical protein VKX45_23800, partial [Bryobacteraceae bacterium]|nr:hypothetical protein [Bryobacteraceae bacterium]
MWKRLLVAMLGLLGASCVHERREAHAQPVPTLPAPTTTAWERQIRNASDAGNGDYELKVLRDRTAAEPDDAAARLELASA